MKRVAIALLLSACTHEAHVTPGEPKKEARTDAGGAPPSAEPSSAAVPPPDPSAVSAPKLPAKVKIFVRSVPNKVLVRWGKKSLGYTPLTIERPRDSGPVDLVLRNVGYFPIHTRAYTVKNDTIAVKMTKLADRMTLFGAREEVPDTPDPLDPSNAPAPTPSPSAPAPLP